MTNIARTRHRNRYCLAVIFLPLVCFSLTLSANELSITPIISAIDEIKSQIDRLEIAGVDDPRDQLATLKKLLRHEQEIGDQLNLGLKRLASEPTDLAASLLQLAIENQFQRLTQEIAGIHERMDAIRVTRSQAPADGLLEFEYDLRGYDDLYSKLLRELLGNTERAEVLGMESSVSTKLLEDTLQGRAERQVDRLVITSDRANATQARLGRTADGERVTVEKELLALEERQQRIALGLDSTIDMLRARNIDANEYAAVLIKSTGEISSDLLDSKILMKLAEDWLQVTRNALVKNGPSWIFKALVFFLILLIAKLLSKAAGSVVGRAVRASPMNFSTLLQQFFIKLAANTVLIIGFLIALAQVGVHLGPVLAGLGVAGLIVGFALQDTLSNFASGLMILIYRPYDVGDSIEAGGVSGKVQRMNLVSTTVQTFDNQKLIVPNNKIWGDVIRNVNAAPTRRVDLVFGIGYDDDITVAENILAKIVADQELVLKDPETLIKVHKLGESSVDFIVRPWVNAADYWTVYWDITRAVKEQFTTLGISIPYPQRDIHLYQHASDNETSVAAGTTNND